MVNVNESTEPFTLAEATLAEVDGLVARYPEKRSAVLPILHLVQQEKGFISPTAMEWVAEKTGCTPIQIYEVVTFYPFFREKPIGKHYIRVCRTLSCALCGGYAVADAMNEELGTTLNHTSPDGLATVEFAECLASCGTGPVVMVDDDLFEKVTPEQAKTMIQQLRTGELAKPKSPYNENPIPPVEAQA